MKFIADYFTSCDKVLSEQFIEYIIAKMNLQSKFDLFKKLLLHFKIDDLAVINDKDYTVIDKFDKVIKFRNLFAHAVLDQNFKDTKELSNRQKLNLYILARKTKKQNVRYITITEHREILDLIVEIEMSLDDIVLDLKTMANQRAYFLIIIQEMSENMSRRQTHRH